MPGTIVFKPIEAKFAHEGPKITHIQPVCVFTMGNQKLQTGQSRKEAGVHAKWDDTITLNSTQDSSCLVELKDKDSMIPNDRIGSFSVNLKDLESQGKISKWFTLQQNGEPVGEMLLEASSDSPPQWAHQDSLSSNAISDDAPSKIIVNDMTKTEQSTQPQHSMGSNPANLQSLFNQTNEDIIQESFKIKNITEVPEMVHNNTDFRNEINKGDIENSGSQSTSSFGASLNQGFIAKQGDSSITQQGEPYPAYALQGLTDNSGSRFGN